MFERTRRDEMCVKKSEGLAEVNSKIFSDNIKTHYSYNKGTSFAKDA